MNIVFITLYFLLTPRCHFLLGEHDPSLYSPIFLSPFGQLSKFNSPRPREKAVPYMVSFHNPSARNALFI